MGALLFLKDGTIRLPKDQKVLKAADYLQYVEAVDVVQKAREEAARLVAAAEEVYETRKREGFEDGLLEGKMDISEQMMDTVAGTVEYVASLEKKVVEIVTSALKKIIGELDESDLIIRVVRNALNVARNQKQVTLRVSPAQTELVKQRLGEIMAGFAGIQFIDVVADGRLEAGGCILETEMGIVDASVDVQLEAIQRSLSKGF